MKLKEILFDKRMSQSELSRRAGLNATTVSQIVNHEDGRDLVYDSQKVAIAKALEVQVDDIDWPLVTYAKEEKRNG